MCNEIKLNDILQISKNDLKRTKIRLNRNNGIEEPIDIFKSNPVELLNWNFWNNKKYKRNAISIGLVDMGRDRWLLFTVAIVDDVDCTMPENTGVAANYHEWEDYRKFFGRVIVHFENKSQQMFRNAETLIDKLKVVEILPSIFTGFDFPGYDKVHISWHDLFSIVYGPTQVIRTHSKIRKPYILLQTIVMASYM